MRPSLIDLWVCFGWAFIWQPLFLFAAPAWLFEELPPFLAGALIAYGTFLPVLVWVCFIEPWQRWRQVERGERE